MNLLQPHLPIEEFAMDEREIKAAFEIFWKREMNTDVFPLTIQEYPMGKGWSYCDHNTHRSWLSFREAFALGIGHQTREPDISVMPAQSMEDKFDAWIKNNPAATPWAIWQVAYFHALSKDFEVAGGKGAYSPIRLDNETLNTLTK